MDLSDEQVHVDRRTESERGGAFAHAHDFTIENAQMNEINNLRIDTMVIQSSPPIERPLSPLKNTAPRTSRNFVGQQKYLSRMHEHFKIRGASDSKRKMFLLYGVGGIGKTQICYKFCEESKDRFVYTFWVDSTSEDTIVQSLKEAYKMITPTGTFASSFSAAIVLNRISSFPNEWIMIYDNADGSPELIEKFLPPGNAGNILITSRNPALRSITSKENSMEILEMDEYNAVELLFNTSGVDKTLDVNIQEANIAIQALHRHPLAIDMAGAYISQVGCEIKEFNKLYRKYRSGILDYVSFRGQSGYNKTFCKTYGMSFQKIKDMTKDKDNIKSTAVAEYALILLNICAYFHYDNILTTTFERAARYYRTYREMFQNADSSSYLQEMDKSILNIDEQHDWNQLLFNESMSLLQSYSFIKITPSKASFSMHPLVHAYCQDRLDKSEKQVWSLNAKAIILSSVSPDIFSSEHAYINELLPHFLQNFGNEVKTEDIKYYDDIFNLAANILKTVGKYPAELHYRQRIVQVHLKDDTVGDSLKELRLNFFLMDKNNYGKYKIGLIHTLNAVAHLAYCYRNLGNTKDAENFEIQVLHCRQTIFGKQHPDTLMAMANLASTYDKQQKWNDAEKLNMQVLKARQQVLGAEHPDTLWSMANLASIYHSQGRFSDAETLQKQVFEARQKILGKEHLDTLWAMAFLARTYQSLGKWSDAETLNTQILEIRRQVLGKEHPDTIWAMANLGSVYHSLGKFFDAEKLEVQVLKMRQQIYGKENVDTMWAMAYLARTYKRQGKLEEVENLERDILEMRKRMLGEDNLDTIWAMANLASTYRAQGKFPDAEKLEVQVLEMRRNFLDREHPDLLWAMANLASTYRQLGKLDDSETLEVEVLDIRQRILGNEHPDTLWAAANLACTYRNQQKLIEAEELEVRILRVRDQIMGKEHPDTILAMANLASTYHSQGRFDEAEKLQLQVLETREVLFGKDHPDTVLARAELASTINEKMV